MADSFLQQRPRRLPVFFILDTSMEMGGTFQVTMQDGLLVVKRELAEYTTATHCVFLSGITFGEKATLYRLKPVNTFSPPIWQAQGSCNLKPALETLTEALRFDLIVTRPNRLGDYAPLVFLILGSNPTDSWQEALGTLAAFADNRRPLIVTLVTRPELVSKMRVISNYTLLLKPSEAVCITNFFFWVAQAIIKVCQDCERGATSVDFPNLPYGIVVPR